MDPLVSTGHVSVLRLGVAAREVLADSSGGRVLAVVSSAVYLESDRGELTWLTTNEAPMHGRGISLRGPLPRPAVGEPYVTFADGLILDEGTLTLTWRGARVWRPPPIRVEACQNFAELSRYLPGVHAFVEGLPAPRGLAVLLHSIMARPREPLFDVEEIGNSRVLRRGITAISAIADAGRTGNMAGVLAAAEDLIGLGEGLTPSGDDFVGGMLFGAATLQATYRLPGRIPGEALQCFLTRADPRTTRLSSTLLRDYATGQGPEALHQYVQALLAGRPMAELCRLASDVIRIGASTGWDCLTGLWMALGMFTAAAVPSIAERPAGPRRTRPRNVEPWISNRRSRRPTTKQHAA
jgi:hypothetical protein